MEPTGAFYTPHLFSLLSLAVMIAAALIAAAWYWRRRRRPTVAPSMAHAAAPKKIIYHDAPTVRVTDSQRVDRLRRVARLSAGEFFDVIETHADLPPRFRITLKHLVAGEGEAEGGAVAHIAVEFGGAAVSCGPLVREIGFNEFVLPRTVRDEPRNAVYHYQESGGALDFMRVRLRAINVAEGWVDIDVLRVSCHWPATQE